MTEQEDPSRERLKHHFAQRVIHQARQILEIWQRLQGIRQLLHDVLQ